MTFISEYQEEFCQEIHTVYYVNEDHQSNIRNSAVSSQVCPHCKERHVFRVFDSKGERKEEGRIIKVYDGKCPACSKEFDIEIDAAAINSTR